MGEIMATFVLVHGAWLGGWCWQRVASQLRAQGHTVFSPSLTGLGDRDHLLNDSVDLNTHIADIAGIIRSYDLTDVVLCGHSYGGLVITGVADCLPGSIKAMVYLDALVPEDGQSMFDTIPEALIDRFEAEAAPSGGLSAPPMSAAEFGTNEADQAWVDDKGCDHPMQSFRQHIVLSGAYKAVTNRHFILAPAFEHPSTHGYFAAFKDDPTWQIYTLEGGHHLMIDNPDGVVEILLGV
jgi:pimeloyl-ACP methyl ester carboxylesterase